MTAVTKIFSSAAYSATVCCKNTSKLSKLVILLAAGGTAWTIFSLQGHGQQLRGNGVLRDLVVMPSKQSDIFDEASLWRNTSYRYSKRTRPCTTADKCFFQVIADLDHKSRTESAKPSFKSHLLSGEIWQADDAYHVQWRNDGKPEILYSAMNEAGRGLELSDLTLFGERLYTFDDRTGMVFALLHSRSPVEPYVLPVQVLVEGDGITSTKGQKIEWATEKDGLLWIGSFGKEYVDNGEVTNHNNMWVAIMDRKGNIRRRDWSPVYTRLREVAGAAYPGYLVHESARWSSTLKRWVFLPRRVSSEPYDEQLDNRRGSNIMLVATEDFDHIDVVRIETPTIPERGFSAFAFLPGSDDQLILAVKTEEDLTSLVQRTFMTIFDMQGKVFMPDTLLPDNAKYEGLEIFTRKEVAVAPH
ncbi:MAG: uncharacterized protein KVP18_001003 [Porospora cf. gigantea A]|uniref:uncharacterized protein n=1 Tax=Porospora cf. gigantea A TaxID=2853593 RepID=UPI003559886B|nr:MAG: hypothetical protein KVP18_001003 [Porospora cf. gigantea A]